MACQVEDFRNCGQLFANIEPNIYPKASKKNNWACRSIVFSVTTVLSDAFHISIFLLPSFLRSFYRCSFSSVVVLAKPPFPLYSHRKTLSHLNSQRKILISEKKVAIERHVKRKIFTDRKTAMSSLQNAKTARQ